MPASGPGLFGKERIRDVRQVLVILKWNKLLLR